MKYRQLISSFILGIIILLLAIWSNYYSSFSTGYLHTQLQQQQQLLPQQKQQQQSSLLLPTNKLGIKITSPTSGQQVTVGALTIFGKSTDNPTTNCQVFVDWNNLKPMQKVMATGPGGENDYSSWTFTYTKEYHLITQGVNELTAKLSCITGPFNSTKYYSTNVQGSSSSSSIFANSK